MPVWMFHGDADESVPVTESRKMTDVLKSLGSNVRYASDRNTLVAPPARS